MICFVDCDIDHAPAVGDEDTWTKSGLRRTAAFWEVSDGGVGGGSEFEEGEFAF